MIRRLFARLRRQERGATVIEFAIVAPVFVLFLMGAFDVAHTLYVKTALEGIVQKAARDASLETGTAATVQQALDDEVTQQIAALVNNKPPVFKRRFYRTFAEAADATPEDWDDTNKNGTCDKGERYEDANLNGNWDADGGDAGQGGAKDATVYTVTLTYRSLFPLYKFIRGTSDHVVSAETVLRNQPYNDQDNYAAAVWRNCK